MVALNNEPSNGKPDYTKILEEAFEEYKNCCYPNQQLSPVQYKEIRQAFLSGIHWLNSFGEHDHNEILTALIEILFPPQKGTP